MTHEARSLGARDEHFTLFYGGPLSNWFQSPFAVDGVRYSGVEQYMMAQKARLFRDEERLAQIMATASPNAQKALGRQVERFRKDLWEAVARDVMMRGLLAKFTSTIELYAALMSTEGTTIVEASPTDTIWGIGLHEYDEDARDRSKWRGSNWLGQLLTDLREDLLRASFAHTRL